MTLLRHTLLASLAALAVTAAPDRARADCAPTCMGLLCSNAGTIVTGTVMPDPAAPGMRVVVVGSVLRVGTGATAPRPGDQLKASTLSTVESGPVVAYYQGIDLGIPIGLFAVGNDGNVHCRGEGEQTSAPEGTGVTPQRLATLAGTDMCMQQLKEASYTTVACDDTGIACSLRGQRPGRDRLWLLGVTVVPLALALARARRRRSH
jgi:hypothetical protein